MTLPYSLERDLMDRKTKAVELFHQGYGADLGLLDRLLTLHGAWPDLAPGAKLAFAQAGLSADDPTVKAAARLTAQSTLNRDAWMRALPTSPAPDHIGHFVKRVNKVSSVGDFKAIAADPIFARLPKTTQKAIADQAIKGELSGGLLSTIASDLGYSINRAVKGDVVGAVAGPSAQQATPAEQDLTVGNVNISQHLRDLTREAANAGISGLQATQGIIRNEVGGGTPLFSASGQGLAEQTNLGQELHGLSAGDGILPDPNSPAALAAANVARQTAPTIDGHAFTIGRATALGAGEGVNALFGTHVLQPGSTSYNVLSGLVDAGIAIKGDPTAQILRGIGDAREAGKVFTPEQVTGSNSLTTSTGLAPLSVTPEVLPNTKTAFLNSPSVEPKLQTLASTQSPSDVIRYMGGTNAVSPELAQQLAETSDVNAVRQVFQDNTLPYKPTFGGFGYEVQSRFDSRMLAQMPNKNLVDLNDKAGTWTQLERTLQATNMPTSQRNVILDQYLASTSPHEAMDSFRNGVAGMVLQHRPDDLEFARGVAKAWSKATSAQRSYDVNQATGLERIRPGMVIGGEGQPFPNATADSERLNSLVSLPRARDLRKLTTKYGALLDNPAVRNSSEAIDGLVNAWKTTIVARPQLLAKITGESQFNLALRDYLNIFSHPKQFMDMLAGTNMDTRFGQFLANHAGADPSFLWDVKGQPILDEAQNLLQRSIRYPGQDPGSLVTLGFQNAPISDSRAAEGLTEALGRMHTDPIFRGVAQQPDPLAAKEWFFNGEGAAARLARAPITAQDDAFLAQGVAAGKYGPNARVIPVGDIANSRTAADAYVDDAHFARLNDLTGGHEGLLDAVRTGKLNGKPLMIHVDNGSVPNPAAVTEAQSIMDAGFGPKAWVPVRDTATVPGPKTGMFNRAMDFTFHYMLDVPDKVMNRVPAYVQAYWKRVIDMAPYTDPETLATLRSNAAKANLPDDLLGRLTNLKLDATDTPRLSLNQIHDGAKAMAVTDLGKVAHDLTTRTNLFDRLRWFIPFGDAWRLVMKRAGQLIAEEPQTLQRLNAGFWEAKQPGSDTLNKVLGNPVPPGQPFFHKDPLNGDLSVSVPGSGILTQATFGVPIPLDSSVKGLTMASDAMPGVNGLVLTLPAKWLLPDTPTGNAIKDALFPFGGAESNGPAADIVSQFAPAWALKLTQSYPNHQAYASAFNMALKSLASTGDYNLNKPSDLARLADDAKTQAKWMYTIRGAAQFLIPGAPVEQNLVKGTDGKWVDATVLAKAYRDKQAAKGSDAATQWLINNFGVNNIFATQAASQPVGYAAPVTKKSGEWVDAHPDSRTKYPLTYGLIVPAMPGDKFDTNVYSREAAKGSRVPLSETQQIAQAENRLGFFAYNNAVSKTIKANGGLPPDKPQREALGAYRDQLKHDFPGFDTYTASPYDTRARRNQAIEELASMLKDKAVTSTDAGQGLAAYFQVRNQAIDQAIAGGGKSPFAAKAGAGLRAWLRDQANAIIKEHPQFAPMWNDVFSREMVSD